MQMEVGTLSMLTWAFTIVIIFSLIVIVKLWCKNNNKAYTWFVAQLAFLSLAFYKFGSLLQSNSKIPEAMLSEENSLALGISIVLWGISMGCMLIGIANISKKKS